MGLNVGNVPVTAAYVGSTPVAAVYVGAQKIWPTTDVVQITLGAGFEARDQFRAALSARGLNYQTITNLPFDIELVGTGVTWNMFDGCSALTSVPKMNTSSVTSMANMFNGCSALTSVPDLKTSNVTNMYAMFWNCSSLTSVPDLDTSNVTSMGYMFGGCSSLVSVPDLDTTQVTNMKYMFYGCSALTDGNVRLIGRHPNVNTSDMITNSGLTREPFYKADGTPDDGIEVVQIPLGTGFATRDAFRSALTSRGLDYQTVTELPFDIEFVGTGEAMLVFQDCFALTTVPEMDLSGAWNAYGLFQQCFALTSVPPLHLENVTNAPSVFAYCRALTSVADIQSAKMTNVSDMFTGCTALKDGNVRLMGKNPNVNTANMISGSGLTRLPFYDTNGNPI